MPVRFGKVIYIKNEYVRLGNWGSQVTVNSAPQELVDYFQQKKGVLATHTNWDGHQFVLTGKSASDFEAVKKRFDNAVEELKGHIFRGSRFYIDGVRLRQTPDYLQVLQQRANESRDAVIKMLKTAVVWQNAQTTNLHVVKKLDKTASRTFMNRLFQ